MHPVGLKRRIKIAIARDLTILQMTILAQTLYGIQLLPMLRQVVDARIRDTYVTDGTLIIFAFRDAPPMLSAFRTFAPHPVSVPIAKVLTGIPVLVVDVLMAIPAGTEA